MKFLFLTQYYYPEVGAAQVRLRATVRSLIELGHEVEVVTALPNYPQGKIHLNYRGYYYLKDQLDGVIIHRVWIYAATGAGVGRLCNYLSFVLLSMVGLRHCVQADFIFVESPPLFLSLTGFMISRYWRAKMIFNIADLWPDSARELGLVKNETLLRLGGSLERWSYKKAYKITAVTQGIRKVLIEKGICPEKLLFLPNGVDINLFKPRPPDKELADSLGINGKNIILFAGNLGFAHGLDIVLKTAELLTSHLDILFVLIGAGSEKARLQKAIKLKFLNNILFLEPAPQEYVSRLYSLTLAALVTLKDIPLLRGGVSAKTLPAMAAGVPILYCGKGEGAQLVKKSEAGLVLSPENPEALADGVLQLVNDPVLARKLGLNGRSFAEANLQWSKLVNDWLAQME